jgi:hypothetical protein
MREREGEVGMWEREGEVGMWEREGEIYGRVEIGNACGEGSIARSA